MEKQFGIWFMIHPKRNETPLSVLREQLTAALAEKDSIVVVLVDKATLFQGNQFRTQILRCATHGYRTFGIHAAYGIGRDGKKFDNTNKPTTVKRIGDYVLLHEAAMTMHHLIDLAEKGEFGS